MKRFDEYNTRAKKSLFKGLELWQSEGEYVTLELQGDRQALIALFDKFDVAEIYHNCYSIRVPEDGLKVDVVGTPLNYIIKGGDR